MFQFLSGIRFGPMMALQFTQWEETQCTIACSDRYLHFNTPEAQSLLANSAGDNTMKG